ncbi:hypothetical protein KCP73_18795 [Salmonella enterica subsp. enterica]|nr:hypothetical protein KCP73_18795 [Salmonella enterica subsp. enterica]
MTLEQEVNRWRKRGEEVLRRLVLLNGFAEERIYGDTIPGHQADKRLLVIKQPIGVTAAITRGTFLGNDRP